VEFGLLVSTVLRLGEPRSEREGRGTGCHAIMRSGRLGNRGKMIAERIWRRARRGS